MANPVKLQASVGEIEPYGPGTYRVRMHAGSRIPRYKAGQFLHLTLNDFDPTTGFWPESRVFSIASSYGDDYLEIVYSVKGAYTKRMEGELSVGTKVWLKLPYGSFIIDNLVGEDEHVVLIAGGTGLSPFVPFIKAEYNDQNASSTARRSTLHYGVRAPELLLYQERLNQAASSTPNFSYVLWVENFSNGKHLDGPNATINDGILNPAKIVEKEGIENVVYFLSGPPVMIRVFEKVLTEHGIAPEKIQIDEWE